MVRSHHIEYKRQAKLGDRLRVVPHVEVTEGFLSERRVYFIWKKATNWWRNLVPNGTTSTPTHKKS